MNGLRLLVSLAYVSLALAVQIEVQSSGDGMTVICREESSDGSRIGTLTGFVLETVTLKQVTSYKEDYPGSTCLRISKQDETVILPVVTFHDTGDVDWGTEYENTDRLSVTGMIQQGNSSMSVSYTSVRCWDGPSLICVARGDQGTADSPPHGILMEVVPSDVTIHGGQNCPAQLGSRDGCDIFAQDGETMELTCTARIGQPLRNNMATWHFVDNPDKMIGNYRTAKRNSSVDTCEGELTSKLSYKFIPQQDSDMETIACSVVLDRQTGNMTTSKQITVCRLRSSKFTPSEISSWFSPGSRVYKRDIVIFLVGIGGTLALLIIVVLFMCCCGCRLKKVNRKKQMDLNHDYTVKG